MFFTAFIGTYIVCFFGSPGWPTDTHQTHINIAAGGKEDAAFFGGMPARSAGAVPSDRREAERWRAAAERDSLIERYAGGSRWERRVLGFYRHAA
jgi:hypothetical protein